MEARAGIEPMAARASVAAPTLVLCDVHRSYRGRDVLRGVDVELFGGAVTWLGGRNGTGKTTLMRIASGLIRPDRGAVSLHGLDPWRQRRAYQQALGVLTAGNGGLTARLSVRANLRYWAGLALIPRAAQDAVIERAMERFDLAELIDRRVDRLSMGQRQRVRIAMAFLHEPALLLLDEPYTSLDEPGLAVLQRAMDDSVAAGGAVLWIGPSPQLAGLRHDRALWLEDGLVHER